MATIAFKSVGHQYPSKGQKEFALHPMDYEWKHGGAYALLGPSGCGKTTLLNILSGIIRPSEGQVLFDGKDVTALPPQQRNIAQVFQMPVMYETMTVEENLSFPLKNRKVPPQEIRDRVRQVARMLELEAHLTQRAAGLSPHLKQIISVGRGIVRQDVAAILFDEPLTMIDPMMKGHLRRKLKEVHKELNVTLIYVTHDQTEALTFAESVMVMRDGRPLQTGSPEELFEHPAHPFIGHFIGSPGMNFFPGQIKEDFLEMGPFRIPYSKYDSPRIHQLRGQKVLFGCRPRYTEVGTAHGSLPGRNIGQILQVEDRGTSKVLSLRTGEARFKAIVSPEERTRVGDAVSVNFPLAKVRIFPADQTPELTGEQR